MTEQEFEIINKQVRTKLDENDTKIHAHEHTLVIANRMWWTSFIASIVLIANGGVLFAMLMHLGLSIVYFVLYVFYKATIQMIVDEQIEIMSTHIQEYILPMIEKQEQQSENNETNY